ncbi:hypothetical protein ACFL35_09040 [Candidatus Riflebacteria bacterium]
MEISKKSSDEDRFITGNFNWTIIVLLMFFSIGSMLFATNKMAEIIDGRPVYNTRTPGDGPYPESTAEPVYKDYKEKNIKPTPPSVFGILTSRQWAYGHSYKRRSLPPVKNPHPNPEPQPDRDHPHRLALSEDGTKAYITLIGAEIKPGTEVAVFDVQQKKVIKRILLKPFGVEGEPGYRPYHILLHPGGRFMVVTNQFSNFASVIDTKKDEVVTEIPLDFYCEGFTFSKDGTKAYFANRYLDQVFVVDIKVDGDRFEGKMRILGGMDDKYFFGQAKGQKDGGIYAILKKRCIECHKEKEKEEPQFKVGEPDAFTVMEDPSFLKSTSRRFLPKKGGFIVSKDKVKTFLSVIPYIRPGLASESHFLRVLIAKRYGGYGDILPRHITHARGTIIFRNPHKDPDYKAIAAWINAGDVGPGIAIGNEKSKPNNCVLSTDGKYLFVGEHGGQCIAVVSTKYNKELGPIWMQNVVGQMEIYKDPGTGDEFLIATSLGLGFGTAKERDPFGGEGWDRDNPATHFTVWRNPKTAKAYPKSKQLAVGPFQAIDNTSQIKFRDIQNDIIFIKISDLNIPKTPPRFGEYEYILKANYYQAHKDWVRYTCDSAESTYADIKGDISPALMRVQGAYPDQLCRIGDEIFVTMQGSLLVQQWKINPKPAEPIDYLMPVRTLDTGFAPMGIVAGKKGTPSAGKLFVANQLGGTLSIIDIKSGKSTEFVVDPSILRRPVPDSSAELGECFAHSSIFSSDEDTSCIHCHHRDMGDTRPWSVSQVMTQEYLRKDSDVGQLTIGSSMGTPQIKNLYENQPFFYEGVINGYEPTSMIKEHNPSDDYSSAIPGYDQFTKINAHYFLGGADDLQSAMDSDSTFNSDLEERCDAMFRRVSLKHFGKAYNLKDYSRFVGDWQLSEPRLFPNPYDQTNASILRGRELFFHMQLACANCHTPPNFTNKNRFRTGPNQAPGPQVLFTIRDAAFTLISLNRMDAINKVPRDVEPWDAGRVQKTGNITVFPLRGIWDRPAVFFHNGLCRTLRESVCVPGHLALRKFKYMPLQGGEPERPNGLEVGFNETVWYTEKSRMSALIKMNFEHRIGFDTHGGTSQLTVIQVEDLVNFLLSIE